jgi:nicotinamide-nucleotide amidase
LLGQIVNSNAQRISGALAGIGVDVFFHTVVGDNLERATEAVSTAAARSDVVIVTGGLGPTPDDLTREAVSRAFGQPLKRDERLAEWIRDFFAARGRPMPEENLRQADLPEGATPIDPEGTAPGFFIETDSTLLFALPGVPWEMRAMLERSVLPELRRRAGDSVTLSREVLVVGLGESHTHERIADFVAAQSNPTIAYLAGSGRVRVRITAKARTEGEAEDLIAPVEAKVRDRLGEFAVAGGGSLAEALGKLLRARELTVAVAESLTGGLIAVELTEAAGASDFFAGSIVTYTDDAKRAVAGVEESILKGPGPVSGEAAAALAEGAARVLRADLGLSATGVAGPTEQDGKPVGTIFVAASFVGDTEVREVQGYGDRLNVRRIAATAALNLGRLVVQRSA